MQRITKRLENKQKVAERYYALISTANELCLGRKEIKLIAFIALNGMDNKAFSQETGIPTSSVYNMIGRLKKKNFLVKVGGKVIINPLLTPDFNNVKLEINLKNGEAV